MRIKSLVRVVLVTAVLLLVPFLAMLFTDEVNWGMADFVVMGALLIITGLAFELVATKVKPRYRPIAVIVVFAVFLLVWAELAVGVFGTPFAGS